VPETCSSPLPLERKSQVPETRTRLLKSWKSGTTKCVTRKDPNKRDRVFDGVEAQDHVSLIQCKSTMHENSSVEQEQHQRLENAINGFLTGSLYTLVIAALRKDHALQTEAVGLHPPLNTNQAHNTALN
jgi:hypothetical protein